MTDLIKQFFVDEERLKLKMADRKGESKSEKEIKVSRTPRANAKNAARAIEEQKEINRIPVNRDFFCAVLFAGFQILRSGNV